MLAAAVGDGEGGADAVDASTVTPARVKGQQVDGDMANATFGVTPGMSHSLSWTSSIASTGAYNRSTLAGRRVTFLEAGTSRAEFSAPAACFHQTMTAAQGRLHQSLFDDTCVGKPLRTALCVRFDGCAVAREGVNAPGDVAARRGEAEAETESEEEAESRTQLGSAYAATPVLALEAFDVRLPRRHWRHWRRRGHR